MSGVFDRLQGQLDERAKEGGISPIDLAHLSPKLRKIMRFMLREVESTYEEICQAVDAMPEDDRLNREELDEALDDLTKQFWLIRMGEEGGTITYKVNLRAKPASTLASNIWASLDSKITEQSAAAENADDAEDRRTLDLGR